GSVPAASREPAATLTWSAAKAAVASVRTRGARMENRRGWQGISAFSVSLVTGRRGVGSCYAASMKCLLLLFAAIASAQQPATRILVAYHSDTGNTAKLAEAVRSGAASIDGVTV